MRSELATALKAALIMTPKAEMSSGFVVSAEKGVVDLWPDGDGVVPEDTIAGHFIIKMKAATPQDVEDVNENGYTKAMDIMSLGSSASVYAVPSCLWSVMRNMAGAYMMKGLNTYNAAHSLFESERQAGYAWYGVELKPLFVRALLTLFSGEQGLDIAFVLDTEDGDGEQPAVAGSYLQVSIARILSLDKYRTWNKRLRHTLAFLHDNPTKASIVPMMGWTDNMMADLGWGLDSHVVNLNNLTYKGEEHVVDTNREDGAEPGTTLVSLLREGEECACPARKIWRQACS